MPYENGPFFKFLSRFNNNTTMNGEGPSAVGSSGGTWTIEGNEKS